MLEVSSRLGPYEIVAPLGAGGMGEVYRARDTRLGREVAVKVLPAPFANDPDRRARFEREVRAVAALSHPNILAIHDYGTHAETTYAVMELLEGETLRARLVKGPLSWREAVEIGAAIAEGLAAAHAKGIVHRDLKPENLFLTADGRVKILDFGLARITPLANTQSETGPYVPAETNAGTVMGTVGYMSPEQVRGQPADARSDIFSFGCVLYEMVTGRRAFQRETAAETMTAVLHDEPPVPTGSDHQVPAEVERVIRQCLAKSPHQRLQSARDLALGLRATASDPGIHPSPPARRSSKQIVGIVAATLLLVVGSASVYLLTRGGNRSELGKPPDIAKAVGALAVLPFINGNHDPKEEYLSNGVPEGIIDNLARMRKKQLRVTSFNVVSRYKGQTLDAQKVGDELKVQAILTGNVMGQGEKLTISVELVDAVDSSRIWGKRYNGKLTDLQALQEVITRDVVENLGIELSIEEQRRLVKRPTEKPEAYRLYQLGRFFWNKRNAEGFNEGIKHFRQAIEIDSGYALAYAGLADSYALRGLYGLEAPKEVVPQAKLAAQKALKIDETLVEPRAMLALVKFAFDWDWSGAEMEFKRAIQLNPAYAPAHSWYGLCLLQSGRLREARLEYDRALELEPASLAINSWSAAAYYYAGQYEQAVEHSQKTIALDPNFGEGHRFLGLAFEKQGRYADAVAEFRKAVHEGGDSIHRGLLGHAHALAGNRIEAEKLLDELIELRKKRYVSAYAPALIYTGLGQTKKVFEWLEKAYEEGDNHLTELKMEPIWESLRSELQFADLVRRVGFPAKAVEVNQSIHSVAVLPFENVGGDPKTEFLSDGVADQIINSLSQVRRKDLKVRPFTSVARYKGKELHLATAGRELNVQMIVTGTLRQQGDELQIHVALVDVREEENNLWSDTYRGKLGEILDLQDKIARDVAANLRLRLTGEEEQRLTKRYTEDPEAYLLYREALYHFNKFTPLGFTTGIEYCERAIKKDPDYALAYVSLARCHIVSGLLYRGPRETFLEARKHVAMALKLDGTLPDAHSTLAQVYLFHDWNWEAAERELTRAIALDPNVVRTHNLYGVWLAAHGRLPEALASIRRAQELEPLVAARRYELAMCYNWMRQHDEAIGEEQKALALDPNFPLAYHQIGIALVQKGKPQEASAELQKALNQGPRHPSVRGMLGYAYAAAGQRAEAQKVLEELETLAQKQYGFAYPIARIHAALGQKDQAFKWLRKACEQRDHLVIWIKADLTLDNLRSDPQFAQVLQEMKLPP